tara:strand:- start:691 stop:1797 length:1107 start_codon:yes stop_codon:yes gene_type:complete
MITLNELAYNIKNIAYGGESSDESSISTNQIKFWIHYHRAKLIADNINKGILDRSEIYQDIHLNNYNTTSSRIKNYIESYNLFLQGKASQPALLEDVPADAEGKLYVDFIPTSPISRGIDSFDWSAQMTRDMHGQDFYSDGHTRGNFRNRGYKSFTIPEILLLDHKKGFGKVRYTRTIYREDLSNTPNMNEFHIGQSFQAKEMMYRSQDDVIHSGHNRFTNLRNEPFYQIDNKNINSSVNEDGGQTIILKNLRVTPNYHDNYSQFQRWFFAYKAFAQMIFQNPTEVPEKAGYDPRNFSTYNNYQRPNKPNLWDDSKDSYPMPMDLVGDLIQRVIQSEVQPSLKTMPDIVGDNFDDTTKMKISGAQVQR